MITVEILQEKNLVEFTKLISDVISGTPYYSPHAIQEELKRFTLEKVQEYFLDETHFLIVALKDGVVVGFRVAYFDAGILQLDWTGVKSEFRGQGIAQKIHKFTFDYLLKHASSVHKICCDTRTNNIESISLLRKMGFTQIAQVFNHWYCLDYILWEKLLHTSHK